MMSSMRVSRSWGQPLARSCLVGQGPNALVRIQLRGVGGETLQAQTRVFAEELIQRCAFMGWGIVQKHDHPTAQVSQQMTEEDAHLLLPDVVEPKLVIEAEVLSPGTDRDSRDNGDSLSSIPMTQDRSLAPGGPGLDHVGDQQEPGFVDED